MILENYIQQYISVVGPVADDALETALLTIASKLGGIRFSETSAEKFAEEFFELLKTVFVTEWDSGDAKRAIKNAVTEIYRFYRTQDDLTVFDGEDAGIRIRFGDIDRQTLRFFEKLDHFYFSKYLDNSEPALKKFFADEYVAKGGRSVDGLTAEQIEDIRASLGDKLKNVNDVNVERIVRGATVRARNWAHINRMAEAKIEMAQIIAVLDERTSEICRFLNGKFLRIGAASAAVDRLSQLEPGDFAKEVYQSPAAKALRIANENAEEVEKFFAGKVDENGVLDDGLMAKGYGMPPYHVSCRTRLKSVIAT